MAYPQGSTITKANMISDFNTLVISARNSAVIWALGEGAWGGGSSGDPFYPNNSIGTYVSGSGDPLGARTASSAVTGSLSSVIGATNIYNTFVSTANAATNIRTVRLIKYYNTDGTYNIAWDYTRVGSMNSTYLTGVSTSSNPTAGALITAAGLDNFVASIVNSMTSIRNTTVTFQEFYCHTSCHSSCHSSRGRR